MKLHPETDNLLLELATSLAGCRDHATAVALRRLAREGFETLDQVHRTSDWTLLSIRGIGVRLLARVRALTRPEWQPPSAAAIRTTTWFLSAARFALRFWSPETLAAMTQGSPPRIPTEQGVEASLALDIYTKAAHEALGYCNVGELGRLLMEICHDSNVTFGPNNRSSGCGPVQVNGDLCPDDVSASAFDTISVVAEIKPHKDSEHFAYPRNERRKIVEDFWRARRNGEVANKEQWARANHGISARTLLRYENQHAAMAAES